MEKLKAVISQLGFFSIIPVKVSSSLEEVASVSFIAPVFVGVISGLVDFSSLSLAYLFMGYSAKFLLLGVVEVFRGFHHLDGLLDTGDGLMVMDRDRKLKAMKDTQVGAGGIGIALVYLSLMLTAISMIRSPSSTLVPLISAEVLSRGAGMLSLILLKPLEGSFLGQTFSKYLRKYYPILVITLVPFVSFYALLIFVLVVLISLGIERNLGGSSGDVVGAVITLSFPMFLIGELECSSSLFSLLLSTF